MNHVRVWVQVKIDNTGNAMQLPAILCLDQKGKLAPLEPLLYYMVNMASSVSHSWMKKMCEVVGKLIDYLMANRRDFTKPDELFLGFSQALHKGTVVDGLDPSGLYWLGGNSANVQQKLRMLEEFSDWMRKNNYVESPINGIRAAAEHEIRLKMMAWHKRNAHSFLGHIGMSKAAKADVMQARTIKQRRKPQFNLGPPKVFPANFERALLEYGFVNPGKQDSKDLLEKYDWRCICITLLLFAGRRVSEPFHMWVGDVTENPTAPGRALVRLYDPKEGQAPDDRRSPNGRRLPNREAYLRTFHPGYLPRNDGLGNYHAGWKGIAYSSQERYFQVIWFPSSRGELFLNAYHMYMRQRVRFGLMGSKHPFAFISHHGKYRGEPFSIRAFTSKWRRAMKILGLPMSKEAGTTHHGPRHGLIAGAKAGGADPANIQATIGHASIESQKVYGALSVEQISDKMDIAYARAFYEANRQCSEPSISTLEAKFEEIWV